MLVDVGRDLAEGATQFTLDEMAARLRCSKSTLYALGPSKEQLAMAVVNHYFKGAAARVEAEITDVPDVRQRIGRYLARIGAEMRSASAEFIADVDAFAPAPDTPTIATRGPRPSASTAW